MRYFIQLSYDGTNYHGWQIQENAQSVQAEVEKALAVVTRETVVLVGAGRTDTGVHASFYMAHFNSNLENLSDENFDFKLNCLLPSDISIQKIFPVRPDAHARFDATYREYKYYLSRHKDPFTFRYAEKESRLLDLLKMNEAAQILFEYNDFTSFSKLGSDVKTNNCVIHKAFWEGQGSQLVFTIRADRFLRNMVRAIVGTLIDVGLGKLSMEDFRTVIEKKNRSSAGASVAAKGLFLVDIGYPDNLRSKAFLI
jgi:tRNA pseudouridine38-40 synthase